MRLNRYLLGLLLLLFAGIAGAQTQFPLNGNGVMGLGNRNGDFFVEQDDLRVKVPGGYARINRDHDGRKWVFNRQWSGLGDPNFYKADYPTIGAFFSCTIIDGINSCDTTASAGTVMTMPADPPDISLQAARIPNDPLFGRLEGGGAPQFVARKGIGFTRSSDGTSYVSSKHPRYVIRPQQVPTLPPSAGPDAHPASGKPGAGGVAVTMVPGYRWIDRGGEWIEYDQYGRIASYGDRNDVRVWFQYGAHGQVERVLDDNGRTVFTLLYAGNEGDFVTEVRDHTPLDGSLRRVQYQYDDKGRLRHVIDARGNTTSYEYGSIDSVSYEYGNGTGTSTAELTVDTRFRITRVIDAEGRATELGYGVTGRLSRIVAPDQGVTEFDYGYDKLKKEFSVTIRHPQTEAGRKVEIVKFDQEGRLAQREVNGQVVLTSQGDARAISYVDARNGATQVTRDAFDEITKIAYADGTSRNYIYEAGSLDVREYVDEAGIRWQYHWDDKGNLLDYKAAAGKPEQQVTEYGYNTRGEAELVRRKGGQNPDGSIDADVEIRMVRDANGNVVELFDGENKRWGYEYDNQGNLTKATNPLGREWLYSYDAHGNLLTEHDPNGNEVSYEYDKTDRLVTLVDARQKVTRFGYDAAGRGATITNPHGQTTTDRFDLAGRLWSMSDESGNATTIGYDNSGRIVRTTDPEEYQTLLEYAEPDGSDKGARAPSKVTYPTFQRLFRYNERQRPTLQTEILSDDALTIGWTYDAKGRVKTQTDPNGHTRTFEYDGLGRMVEAISEIGATVKFGYDHRNNLVSFTNPNGKVTRMEYDKRNLLVAETNALNQTTRHIYDDAGNRTELIRPNGFRVTFQYDPGDRLEHSQSHRADGSIEQTHEYEWDEVGNLKGWTSSRASAVLTYDDADRLLREAVTVDGVSMAREYTYYPNSLVKTYTGPDGTTLSYTYDKNDQLSRVDIPGEGSISVAEWAWFAPKKVVLPGGVVQEMERDGLLGLTRLRVRSPSQTVLFELENHFGKLRELDTRRTDGNTTDFDYDEAVRLIKAERSFATGTSETFVIDKAGNREQYSAVTGTWLYDDANRLVSRGSIAYEYDSAGNLVRKVDSSLAEPLRTTRYVYDGYNRMVEVRDGADTLVAAYAYDPFDNRLAKEVFVQREGAEVGKTLFLHGEEGLLAEMSPDGTPLRTYGWEPHGSYSTSPLFQKAGGTYFYYHNDHLGTPWRVTNRGGAIVWSASDYTAFGEARVSAGAAIEQPWRFAGQYRDAETGLHYNLRRYYDPTVGRYTTEDPIGFEGGPNFYAYAGHSPTNRIDPTGELPILVPIVVNGARAAATRYATCLLECAVVDGVTDLVLNPCDIDVSDCLKDCLWSLLPIKCQKLQALWGGVQGLWNSVFNSFPGDTLVATPSGQRRIEDLRPGDAVLSYAEWESALRPETVTDLILSHHEQLIVDITLSSHQVLSVTGGHPLRTLNGWRAAQLLKPGDRINVKGESGGLSTLVVSSVSTRSEIVPVYNLEVASAHSFFVGVDGVLVHNGFVCKTKIPRHKLKKPKKRGDAPIGEDGHPVELHHTDKEVVHEMTRTDHRLGDNYRKNHDTNNPVRPDRPEFDKDRNKYWQDFWDEMGW